VADQIRSFYGLEAEVLPPPVDCGLFRPAWAPPSDYFLLAGRIIEPYKRMSVVIDAFRSLPHQLVVAGTGPALSELRQSAPPNVKFVGQLDDAQLVATMQNCRAAIFPSTDDFGLIPVEVMACGRPVLAYAGGGALETVAEGVTGAFFADCTPRGVVAAVESFEPEQYDVARVRRHAEQWDVERFRVRIRDIARDVIGVEQPDGAGE
jgi:glycosyltransferase involved in cell wall biosynthesis